MTPVARRLNLGCGVDVRPGWVNLDGRALPGVDVVHDLARPLPFAAGTFDEVLCQDVLEHVDMVAVLGEVHRVTAPGARVHIRSPHFSGHLAHVDPTHVRGVSVATFDYFVSSGPGDDYYFDFAFTAVDRRRVVLPDRRALPLNRPVERWVNKGPGRQQLYEESFLCRLFPAMNVEVELVR